MALYDEPLLLTHPEIAAEWSERNAITPNDVTAGSHDRVWWKGKCGHEWKTSVGNRTSRHTGCPYCTTRAVLKGFNDFATLHPELLNEWSDKNGDLKPDQFRAHSNKKVWWKCKNGHEWQATFGNRLSGNGCRICGNQVVVKGFNDLASKRPDLAAEWSDKNLPLRPEEVLWTKHKTFWWKCSKCGNEYESWLYLRIKRGQGCPYCAGFQVLSGFNDLKTTDPEIAKDWDYDANGSLLPDSYYRTALRFVKWRCSNGHSYGMKIVDRTVGGKGCVICDMQFKAAFSELLILLLAKREGIAYELGSDVSELYLPELKLAFEAEAVSCEKQKEQRKRKSELKKEGVTLRLLPRAENLKVASEKVRRIFRQNRVKVSGKIEDDIQALKRDFFGSDYREVPYDSGGDFKDIPGSVPRGYRCSITPLPETNPELLDEWSEKNFPFKPEDEYCRSYDRVWWRCRKCGYEWKTKIVQRTIGKKTGCPVCAGKVIIKGINDLTTTNPDICKEWSPRNKELDPEKYTRGSTKKVWWRCRNGHEWETQISNRACRGNGCPVCARMPLEKGINDLKTTHPGIIALWSDKNGELKPEDIRASYRKQVWWKCNICGNEFLAQPKTVITRSRPGCKRCQSEVGRGLKVPMTQEELIKEEYR